MKLLASVVTVELEETTPFTARTSYTALLPASATNRSPSPSTAMPTRFPKLKLLASVFTAKLLGKTTCGPLPMPRKLNVAIGVPEEPISCTAPIRWYGLVGVKVTFTVHTSRHCSFARPRKRLCFALRRPESRNSARLVSAQRTESMLVAPGYRR